jgi:hypothetical protein
MKAGFSFASIYLNWTIVMVEIQGCVNKSKIVGNWGFFPTRSKEILKYPIAYILELL